MNILTKPNLRNREIARTISCITLALAATATGAPQASPSPQPVRPAPQASMLAAAASQAAAPKVVAAADTPPPSLGTRPAPAARPRPPILKSPSPTPAPAPVAAPTPVRQWSTDIQRVEVPSGSRGGVTATCGNGTVVSGGWADLGPTGKITSKRPVANGSGYSAFGECPALELIGAKNDLRVRALCIERPAGYVITQVSKSLKPRERTQLEPSCPEGKVVIGGGASGPGDTYLAASAPRLDGGAWTALFRSDALFGDRMVEAFAVCADAGAIGGREIVSTPPAQLGNGTLQMMRLSCPVGKKPLSVGFTSTATTLSQGVLDWSSPLTWSGGVKNNAGLFDNVVLETRLVAICASAF